MIYKGFHNYKGRSFEVFWHDGHHYYLSNLKRKGWYWWYADDWSQVPFFDYRFPDPALAKGPFDKDIDAFNDATVERT